MNLEEFLTAAEHFLRSAGEARGVEVSSAARSGAIRIGTAKLNTLSSGHGHPGELYEYFSHLVDALLGQGHSVLVLDSFTDSFYTLVLVSFYTDTDPHSIPVPGPPEALNRTVVPLLNVRVQRVVFAS
eukprot:SAG25_NODE_808_length_5244_cov_2.525948_2_plen_128_part_00